MSTEPATNQTAARTETGSRWDNDGGLLTEGRFPGADPAHPDTLFAATTKAAATPLVHEPLLTDEAEQGFLNRWVEIQVGFVEDPAESVRDADALIQEIADTRTTAFAARRTELAAAWQHNTPDTEELRLALRRYRSFISVILPK